MLSKESIININKRFDKGHIINESSLDFALSCQRKTKDWVEQLAYILRSILLDHVFEEGNKRTGAALLVGSFEELKVAYNPNKINEIITQIILNPIKDIKTIRRIIKDAIR